MHKVTLIKGDGIGPEITKAAAKVIEATGVEVEWEEALAGEKAAEQFGDPVPEETLEMIRKNKIAMKGPLTNFVGRGYKSPNQKIRSSLDLSANIRRAKSYPGIKSVYENVDLVVVREITEDTYAGMEQMVGPDAAIGIKFVTRKASEKVTRAAFEYARKNNRRKVTVSVKANALKLTDGMFLKVAREIAQEYKDIEFQEVIIDALCMELVRWPHEFDVMVMPNVYGDLVGDLTAGLAGSLGIGHGVNLGEEVAVFETSHGTAPDIAGKNIANPIAMILTGAIMLEHMGEQEGKEKIDAAIAEVLAEGKFLTADLGGKATTDEITDEIVKKINTTRR